MRIGDTISVIPVRLPKEFTMAMGSGEKERFRSFAERYVIERAGHWKPGEEDTGAWAAIQDAKRVYHQIALAGDDVQERIAEAVAHAARITNGLQGGNATQEVPMPHAAAGGEHWANAAVRKFFS